MKIRYECKPKETAPTTGEYPATIASKNYPRFVQRQT